MAPFKIHEDQKIKKNKTLKENRCENIQFKKHNSVNTENYEHFKAEINVLLDDKQNNKKRRALTTVSSLSNNIHEYQPLNIKHTSNATKPSFSLLQINHTKPHIVQKKESKRIKYSQELLDWFSHVGLVDNLSVSLTLIEDYRDDINKYLRKLELENRARTNYMTDQPNITSKMRSILIDWLVSVTEEYELSTLTLHLATAYIDRFLSRIMITKGKLQLLGTSALMIAAKVEEIYPLTSKEYIDLTDKTYTVEQLLKMETIILKHLQFKLTTPTSCNFILDFCLNNNFNKHVFNLALYLSELALVEGNYFSNYLPSQIAASSVALARYTLNEPDVWTRSLKSATGYTLKELSPIITKQQNTFKKSPTSFTQAVNQKYSKSKFSTVSSIKPKVIDFLM